MHSRNWNDALTLLCMMIIADGKVYQEEVQVFKTAAVKLRDAVSPGMMVTEKMAQDWFFLHKDRIAHNMLPPLRDAALAKVFEKLQSLENKAELLSALEKISLSDGHQHRSENLLITQACQAWGIALDRTPQVA